MPNYREYAPAAALRPYVDCYWTNRSAAGFGERRVLPDGCIDILFSFRGGRAAGRIVGTMTRALITPPDAEDSIAAVRFRAGGATPFLLLPACELTDAQAELACVWREREWAQRLAESTGERERVALLESALLARLPGARGVDGRVETAAKLLGSPAASIATVAAQVNVTRQHLGRLFRAEVGIGPKQFERVMRMQRLRRLVRGRKAPDWPALALEAGYFDQSHMIREWKALAGLTPGAFLWPKPHPAAA